MVNRCQLMIHAHAINRLVTIGPDILPHFQLCRRVHDHGGETNSQGHQESFVGQRTIWSMSWTYLGSCIHPKHKNILSLYKIYEDWWWSMLSFLFDIFVCNYIIWAFNVTRMIRVNWSKLGPNSGTEFWRLWSTNLNNRNTKVLAASRFGVAFRYAMRQTLAFLPT